MTAFIIRRLIHSVFLVLLVSLLVFTLIRMLPGDPVMALIDQAIEDMAQGGVAPSLEMQEEIRNRILAEHGMDQPYPIQFANWLASMAQGDFGRSLSRGFDIRAELSNRLIVTLYLSAIAMVVTLVFGILFGTIAAVYNGKTVDNIVTSVSNFGMTVPGFLIAIFLIWTLGFEMQLFPIFGFELPWLGNPGRSFRQTVLPVLTMSLPGIAGLARMTRSAMLDVLHAEYVRTAWAKGLREKAVVFKHVIKNGLMPIVSGVGAMIRGLFGGAVIVETIFVIPGMGQLTAGAVLSLDYPLIQAITVLFTLIAVVSNLITDILYGWVDPRIHFS